MISVQEHPIHCIDGKCIYMSKNTVENTQKSDMYQDVYGKNDSRRRLENLGIPIFVVQTENYSNPIVQEMSRNVKNEAISDDLFDELFSKVDKRPNTREKKKKSTRETKKKRKAKK
jgi:hypothetical protein